MMRLFLLVSLFCYAPMTWALCQVYGISDSPQSLNCDFKKNHVRLSCRNDQYYLNQTPVKNAYHYEVESGPTPLVFDAGEESLVVSIYSPRRIEAELSGRSRRPLSGHCQL